MILVLNLKMNLSKNDILSYNDFIKDKNLIILPQYPYILLFKRGTYYLGSQDVSKYKKGSYTGEVCAKALKQLGVNYSLVGHYERKKYFNETINDCRLKMENLVDHEIIPIYCINETLDEKNLDNEFKSIEEQLSAIPNYLKYIIIAYEPSWLIGSDEVIEKDYLNKVIYKIKEYMMERNINHSIIYGGGINENNINYFKSINGIDGFIISSSALNLNKLNNIYNLINN